MRIPMSRTGGCAFALQPQLAQPGMVVGPAAERPVELAVPLRNEQVVDARVAAAHQAVVVEFPVLVAVGTVPVAGIVVPLVREPHRDAIAAVRPQFLDQAVLELTNPLAGQERDDLLPTIGELGAVAPARV